MKAVGLYKYLPIDHPESLVDLEVDTPAPAGRDLLVEVKAVSVNPVDTKRRAPKELVEKTPKILGWDAAGVVKAASPDCKLFKPGDAVYYAGSVIRQGSNSEYQLVDERIVGRKPEVRVPSDVQITRSVNDGRPIVLGRPKSEAAHSFQRLAEVFVAHAQGGSPEAGTEAKAAAPEAKPSRRSLLARRT